MASQKSDKVIIDAASQGYGQALLELADEAGRLDVIAEQVEQLSQLVETEPDLVTLLSSQAIGREQRAESLEAIFGSQLDELLLRFLRVVNSKHRLGQLGMICRAFKALHDQKRGIVAVDAYVAAALSEDEAQQVAQRIGAALQKQVVLRQHEDASLIGGLKLRIGDQLIDGSVDAKLRSMRQKMIDAGRARARQLAAE